MGRVSPSIAALGRAALPAADRRILAQWQHNRSRPVASGRDLGTWLSSSFARWSRREAVVFADQRWTYARLDQVTGKFACELRARGLGSEDRVGLDLPRGLTSVVAIVGALRAGVAFVPIDRSWPRLRRARAIAGSGLALLCTDADGGGTDGAVPTWPIDEWVDAFVDTPEHDSSKGHSELAWDPPHARSAAYLMYTSGSTGNPKAVVVERDSLARFLASMLDLLRLEPDDRWLSVTASSFDIALLEVLAPLLAGACVHGIDDARARDGVALCPAPS